MSDVRLNVPAEVIVIHFVHNANGEKIEVGYIVTVLDKEHEYGTGHVKEILRVAGHCRARVVYDDGSGEDWFSVHELTNVNVAARERSLRR